MNVTGLECTCCLECSMVKYIYVDMLARLLTLSNRHLFVSMFLFLATAVFFIGIGGLVVYSSILLPN